MSVGLVIQQNTESFGQKVYSELYELPMENLRAVHKSNYKALRVINHCAVLFIIIQIVWNISTISKNGQLTKPVWKQKSLPSRSKIRVAMFITSISTFLSEKREKSKVRGL